MRRPRVLKLGGSLLSLDDWPHRLRTWLSANPHAINLVVVGGGETIEAVRRFDLLQQANAPWVHWLCIDLLDTIAQFAEQLLPEYPSLTALDDLQDFLIASQNETECQTAIVRITAFYSRQKPDKRLPEDWCTTSDSLAALLAINVDAAELVLLKSLHAPSHCVTPVELTQAGIVDPAFPQIARTLPKITVVNLRSKERDFEV